MSIVDTDRLSRPSDGRPMRDRPYGLFVDQAFDASRHDAHHRNLMRFLYRAFRKQQYSSPFSARAQIASVTMLMDRIGR